MRNVLGARSLSTIRGRAVRVRRSTAVDGDAQRLPHTTAELPSAGDAHDTRAQELGLSPIWRQEINPEWMFTPIYDYWHFGVNLSLLARGKTTQMFRYFGKRIAAPFYLLLVDENGDSDKDEWTKALKKEYNYTDAQIMALPDSYWRKRKSFALIERTGAAD